MGTEAESIVNRYENTRNGRATWRALKDHMESTSYMDNIKSTAMAKLVSAHYTGEKKNFGMVNFYQVHSQAHNDLDLAGEPLSDGMKITHFLQGIKEDTAMNFAIATKTEPGIVTFEDFYNSFSAKLSTKLTLTQGTQGGSQRQINAVNSNQQGRGQGRGRGFARGSGRRDNGGRFGRFQRGRGGRGHRGRGYRFNPMGSTHRWQPRAEDYSHDDWNELTNEQKQRVRDLRNYVRSSQNQQHGQNQHNQQRHINQMNRNDGSLPSQIQLPPPPAQQQVNPPSQQDSNGGSVRAPNGRAGDAFSSGNGTGRG